MQQKLTDIFKSPTGNWDSARILFVFGGLCAVVAPIAFTIWNMARGEKFDVTAFCLAYGGMLVAVVLPGAYGIKAKDKGVAETLNALPPQ